MITRRDNIDWWTAFYRDLDLDQLMVREDEPSLHFVVEALDLSPGRTVFDQCCGVGSMSLPLAERGLRVIGVDLCEPYIRRASESAKTREVDCEFHCADAFEFVPKSACDAAFNWYTSFGYAHDDERNLSMLRRAFEALRPGGRFALDYPNIPFLLKNFKPTLVQAGEGTRIVRECELDHQGGMLKQVWTAAGVVRRSALKLYSPRNLSEMLKSCGFAEVEQFGGLAFERLEEDSVRCLSVARKPL